MSGNSGQKWWQRSIHLLPKRRIVAPHRWYPSRIRHNDLLELLAQLRSMASLGIPFHQGLADCVANMAADRRFKRPGPAGRIVIASLIGIWLLSVGLLAIETYPPTFLFPVALVGCVFLLVVVLGPLMRTSRLAQLFNVVRKRLETGASLSETLETMPSFCPPYVVDLVRTGEESCALPTMLDRASSLVQRQRRSHDQFQGTAYYLLFVATLMGLLTWFASAKILPVFWEMYEEFGHSAPESLAAIRGLGDWFHPQASYLMSFLVELTGGHTEMASRVELYPMSVLFPGPLDWIAAALLFLLAGWFTARLGWWRPSAFLVNRLGSVPFFRRSLYQTNAARVSTALAVLLQAGVPLPVALQHAEHLSISRSARKALGRVRGAVEAGLPLSEALRAKGSNAFPESMAAYVALGESSRMLPEALAYLGETCETLEETRRNILSEGFLPVGVLVLGLGVLLLQVAVYQALTGISDAIFYSL